MKRQLIADTLSRVTNPTFRITTCRTGADMELATLQIDFFEQILSAVLLNPEGKDLIITHDVQEFRYNMTTDPANIPGTKLHATVVKKIQCMVCYACFKEESKDTDCNTLDVWDTDIYSKWCQNGYTTYLASLTGSLSGSNAAAIKVPVTSTPAVFVTTAQKDDDAALISWNRNPRNVAKYPLLKNDADYQD
jgi:hypothetical protein